MTGFVVGASCVCRCDGLVAMCFSDLFGIVVAHNSATLATTFFPTAAHDWFALIVLALKGGIDSQCKSTHASAYERG